MNLGMNQNNMYMNNNMYMPNNTGVNMNMNLNNSNSKQMSANPTKSNFTPFDM